MNSMVSHVHGRGSLPPLSTSKDLTRRDSLSSSRTRDSGYNSDLEFSCSPLDYIDSDQHVFLAPLPSLPDTLIRSNSSLINPLRTCSKVPSPPRSHFIDSHPAVETTSTSRLKTKGSKPATGRPAEGQLPSNQDGEIEKWIKDNLPSYNRPDKRVSSIVSLSSATSCEMYTDTDMSEDEHKLHIDAPQPSLTQATMKTIDIIMRKIEVHLRYAAYMQCNGGKTSNTSTNNNASSSQQGSRKASQSSGKRKSRSDDNTTPPNDDQDDNAPNKRRRGSQATISSSELVTRFACPFYKHDPSRFRSRRTCPGPGWLTVHRMKEHLYRAHCQSIYCPRCYGTFDAESDLANHLRSAQCSVNEPMPIEGIDRETLKVLRKRSPAFRLEEDKWRDVYLLLFPEVEGEDVPSPFYDADSPSENSRRFRRDLLRRIQLELVNSAQRLPGPVEQQLLHQVAGIIRRCEHELLSSFDSSSNPALPPGWDGDGRRASGASTLSTGSIQQPTPPNGTPSHMPGYRSNPGMHPPLPNTIIPSGGEHGHGSGMLSPDEQQQLRNFSWSPNVSGSGDGNGNGNGNGAQDLLSYWLDFDAFPGGGSGGGAEDTACYGGGGLGEYAMQMPMGRGQI